MSPREVPANRIEEMRALAISRGGQLISEKWISSSYKYEWKCSCDYIWNAAWSSVSTGGSWCPRCSGNLPRSLDTLIQIADKRNGKLLSTIYSGVEGSYDFECSLGHKFSNRFTHIEKGQWCPTCNKGSKSEEICRTTFEQLFGYEFPKVRPKWLKNSRGNQMEIDGFCKELNIGFEYQGIQHFGKQFHGNSLEKRIEDDELKAKLCREKGIHLFIIDYRMEYVDFPKEISNQAKEFGMNVSTYDFTKEIDIDKAYIRDDRLPLLIELLKKKQITVLSTKWIGVKDKYDFRCDVCGHEWTATGNHFFNTRRVGGCQKCSYAAVADLNRLGLDEMHEFAKKHGGVCLSDSYGHIKHKYKFRCAQGHEFEDIFNNMKFRNRFCPTCEGRFIKRFMTDEEALEILSEFNLRPRGPRPKRQTDGWPATCLVCNEEVNTSLLHLMQRKSPCKYCSGFAISEKKTREVFALANLEPIEPFKSGTAPWKSKCLLCGTVVNGRYSNLIKGQSGCRTCYLKKLESRSKG